VLGVRYWVLGIWYSGNCY